MKLLFRQRLFSWFDSYDIYDEFDETVFTVKGQLSWGHCLKISDRYGYEVGTVKEQVFRFLPHFDLYRGDNYIGCLSRELALFRPKYNIDFNGWHIEGDFMGWDYSIVDSNGEMIACISKELFHLTDTYTIDVIDEENALGVLMVVLAIDADKCSSNS